MRLDEVLAEEGDTLSYAYDYGDGWDHLLTLEAALPRQDDAPRAMCTGGERDGPAEDCGGVSGYELIAAAADPASPDHAAARLEFAEFYGDEVDPGDFQVTAFDISEINAGLGRLGANPAIDIASLPARLGELVQAVRSADGLRTLRRLIASAELATDIQVDPATAERMVRPYAWLLDRVGAGGIRLTTAGCLPPAHVAAAFTELGLAEEWIGRGNREADTWPVLHLRESAQTRPAAQAPWRTALDGQGARRARGPGRVVVAPGRADAGQLRRPVRVAGRTALPGCRRGRRGR